MGAGPRVTGTAPAEGLEQGLYVCVPAEQLTLAGFAQGGEADTMSPGPLLATVVHTVTGQDGAGLAGCSDDQLMGIVSASRRMMARAEWTSMAAMAEYAARHPGTRPGDEFAPDELAYELHLTPQSAAEQMEYAGTVTKRLPATFAALAAGQIHPVHVRIIEDETRFLSDEDAAKADEILSRQAPGLTYGEVRHAAHKLVLRLDPEAARKRNEAARSDTHVRQFREASGNAGMVARELPCDEVLASWQDVEQRALDLRAAGMPGTLQELRVRAYLDLLQERDSRDQPAGSVPVGGGAEASAQDQPPPDSDLPGGADPDDPSPDNGPNGPGGNGGPSHSPGGNGGPGHSPGGAAPSLAALVTITVPLATWQGRSETPGEAAGFGLLDGDDARDLLAAADRHPRCHLAPRRKSRLVRRGRQGSRCARPDGFGMNLKRHERDSILTALRALLSYLPYSIGSHYVERPGRGLAAGGCLAHQAKDIRISLTDLCRSRPA